jgi:hypothetical protein
MKRREGRAAVAAVLVLLPLVLAVAAEAAERLPIVTPTGDGLATVFDGLQGRSDLASFQATRSTSPLAEPGKVQQRSCSARQLLARYAPNMADAPPPSQDCGSCNYCFFFADCMTYGCMPEIGCQSHVALCYPVQFLAGCKACYDPTCGCATDEDCFPCF